MRKTSLNKIISIVLMVFALVVVPMGLTKAATYQPDLSIGYDNTYNYSGGGVYNTDGANQTLYRIIENYDIVGYRLIATNAGQAVDRLIVTGSAGNSYWGINYFDNTGRDITSQVNGSGWYTASLPAGKNETLIMRITPKQSLGYGQESTFIIRATSALGGSQDVVRAVNTIRFNNQTISPSNPPGNQNPINGPVGSPNTTPGNDGNNNGQNSGSQTSSIGYQPDIEIKNSADSAYVGQGIYEKPEAIATQTKTQTTNSVFNPAIFNLKITNTGSSADNFVLKSGGEASGWKVTYFSSNQNKWDDITGQISSGYNFKLASGKSQEYKVEINIPADAANQSSAQFVASVYSANDLNKIDAAQMKITINSDVNGNGLSDACEAKYGLNMKDPNLPNEDPDGDTLTNKEECALGTNPLVKDTDGDGLWDGATVDATKLILPGLKSENFVIAGPTKTAKGDLLPGQTINFVLKAPADNQTTIPLQSNQEGMVVFQIKKDLLTAPGGYTLQTTGNGKVFQENGFFISPYGYVYSKKTKDPLAGVRVNLWRCDDQCCQYYTSLVTDDAGLYRDFMVPDGTYRIKINELQFQPYFSKSLAMTKDGVKLNIFLSNKLPAWLIVVYWVLGILAAVIIIIFLSKLKDLFGNRPYVSYQPDGQIKNLGEKEEEYLGDTIYNLDGLGQTKEKKITVDDTAIFHVRIQNDGRGEDKFLVQAYPPEKGWAIRFFNVLEEGNEITTQIFGGGWESGNLASGLTKDIRLEVMVKDESVLEKNTYEIPIQITSINDPTKSDVVKARAILIQKKKVEKTAQSHGSHQAPPAIPENLPVENNSSDNQNNIHN